MSAGELAAHFDVSKATMSGHFAVLREADLVAAERHKNSITYHLRLSVLEDALLAFVDGFGLGLEPKRAGRRSPRGETP